MDPVSSLSFACNIIQLVEFSTKIVVGAADIYRDGTKPENADLNDVTRSLTKYTATLKRSTSSDPCDAELEDIADKAEKTAIELTALLESLSVLKDAEHRKWKAVRVMVRSLRKQEKVRSLEGRLQNLQALLNLWMLRATRDETSTVQKGIEELARRQKDLGAETAQSLEHMKQTLGKIEELIEQDRNTEQVKPRTLTPDPQQAVGSVTYSGGILDTIKRYFTPGSVQILTSTDEDELQSKREIQMKEAMRYWPQVQEQMMLVSNEAKTITESHEFLRTLYHPDLNRRFGEVEDEYSKTCQWIFDNPDHGFRDWLASGEGTYWISGKPGAGKSTLMKFILHQQETRDILAEWVGENELLIVKHFFWVSGTPLQRSYEGFLRSMLLQYLLRWPHLIPLVAGKLDTFNPLFEPWTLKMLSQCMDRLLANLPHEARILVLADGLDECDHDHAELIGFLDRFVSPRQSKLCVSSRLWNIFERTYRPRGKHLRVEDLTRDDIRLFVEGKLRNDVFLRPVLNSERSMDTTVIDSLLDRAEGVFLWVKLVVRLLLRDAPNEPTIPELHHLITDYPVEIDQLYDRMLQTIKRSGFIQEAARTFLVFMNSDIYGFSFECTIEKIWLMNAEKEDPNYSIARPRRPPTEDERIQFSKAYLRLKGRCMDFFQSPEIEESGTDSGLLLHGAEKVEYFHRTAHDFLMQREQWLKDAAGKPFQVFETTCKATLGSFKSFNAVPGEPEQGLYRFKMGLIYLVSAAKKSESLHSKPLLMELDEAKKCFAQIARSYNYLGSRRFEESEISYPYDDMSLAFLGMVIRYGPVAFVQRELERMGNSHSKPAPIQLLLDFALRPHSTTPISGYARVRSDRRMIQMMLENHADPNGMSTLTPNRTVWVGFLEEIPGFWELESERDDIRQVIGMLLDCGANPFVAISWKYSDKKLRSGTIEELFRELLPPDDPLFEKLAQKRKRPKDGKIWGRLRRRLY